MFKAVAGVNVGPQSGSVLTREEGAQVIPVINTNRELADGRRLGKAQADDKRQPPRDTA